MAHLPNNASRLLRPSSKKTSVPRSDSTKKKVTRKVIVARGEYQFHPLSDTKKRRSTELHIFADTFDSDEGAGGGPAKNLPYLLSKIASRLNCPIINEAHAPPDLRIQYAWHYSSSLRRISDPKDKDRVIRQVLANLEKQTSLQFTFEQRPVDIWFITDEGENPDAGPRVTEKMWDQAGTSQPATTAP